MMPVAWAWRGLRIAFLVGLAGVAQAAAPGSDASSALAQTESVRTSDHPRFVRQLAQLHARSAQMGAEERWFLRYLDAWETAFDGNYAGAATSLREVVAHARSKALVAKANALLMYALSQQGHYEQAVTLANRLLADLPGIHDTLARSQVLFYLSQLMSAVDQYDLAARYARMGAGALLPGESLCRPRAIEATALFSAGKLGSSSPLLQEAIALCQADHQAVFVNTLRLELADVLLREGKPGKAIELLHSLQSATRADGYFSHQADLRDLFARAYWQLGDAAHAKQWALAAIALAEPGDANDTLADAYKVLYQVEKKQGDPTAALSHYEQYVDMHTRSLVDRNSRAMAYQTVQQQTLARKLEAEELARQNGVLRLQQALDAKKVETSRLYIGLLVVVLASILFWLVRIKRSQLRFMSMARRDSLTGIYNHQHFMGEVGRRLRSLETSRGSACLASIDLDHFKRVNDIHGHATGDAALRHAVAICQQYLRPVDVFGRLGGEEFGILLDGCSRAQGLEIAERIRAALHAAPIRSDGQEISLSASIGVASTELSGFRTQQLCKDADAALYRAKNAGRNRVVAAEAGAAAAA